MKALTIFSENYRSYQLPAPMFSTNLMGAFYCLYLKRCYIVKYKREKRIRIFVVLGLRRDWEQPRSKGLNIRMVKFYPKTFSIYQLINYIDFTYAQPTQRTNGHYHLLLSRIIPIVVLIQLIFIHPKIK